MKAIITRIGLYIGCFLLLFSISCEKLEDVEENFDIALQGVENTSVTPASTCFSCANPPAGTIFCDDFESTQPLTDRYFEYNSAGGRFVRKTGVGRDGSAGMEARFDAGTVNAGDLKKSIGRSLQQHSSSPNSNFMDIYWRMDVRFEPGWQGGTGEKLSRATTLLSGWRQGMIAHVWSHNTNKNYLILDPASGIDEQGVVRSTKYNDFPNLRWLGQGTGSTFNWFSAANDGKWHCVVARARLNTPGQSDGIFEFWINGQLQARRTGLNWHGTFNSDPNNFAINTIMFENYWNSPGSPRTQRRYFDNIVISTQPISCDCQQTSPLVDNAVYRITPRHAQTRAVDASSSGNVHQWEYHGGNNQRWRARDRGNGTWSFHPLSATGKAMDVSSSGNIHLWDYHGGSNQRFSLSEVSSGWFQMIAQNNNKCSEIAGGGTANGTTLQQASSCSSVNHQQFRFQRLD